MGSIIGETQNSKRSNLSYQLFMDLFDILEELQKHVWIPRNTQIQIQFSVVQCAVLAAHDSIIKTTQFTD